MLTLDRFTTEWQSLHHFPMDLSGDTPFYYEVYTSLQDIAEKRARRMHGSCIFSLLMYVENRWLSVLTPATSGSTAAYRT